MPIAASVSGTLTRVAAGGSPALGTLSVTGYATNPALGTLSIDRTVFLAFYARVRSCRPDVLINSELMKNLVDTVTLDWALTDPVNYAQFTLSDKRTAFFDPATVVDGAVPVEIDLWAGPPGGVLSWQAFVGLTETCQNTMPYRPRGVIKAVGLASLWANTQGCLSIPAMSGLTRGQIIDLFAQSAGVVIANAAAAGGAIVTKALDLSGMTPFDLIQKWGELEGWFARTTDDGTGLEIISEDHMMDGAPVFSFDESNTFDVPESTPNRPVTDWILSGTQMVMATSAEVTTVTTQSTTDSEGHESTTVTTVTTWNGVEVYRAVTQTQYYANLPGVPGTGPGELTTYTTVVTNYQPVEAIGPSGLGVMVPSTQILSRITTITDPNSTPQCDVGTGFLWADGTQRVDSIAGSSVIAETISETFIYPGGGAGTGCAIPEHVTVTTSGYSPLKAGTGFIYADGSERADTSFKSYETSRVDEQWLPIGTGLGFPPDAIATGYNHLVATSAFAGKPTETYQATFTASDADTPPAPGSATTPQYSQQVMVAEFDATDASGYSKLTQTETIDFAESVAELNSIARRRIRRACSDQLAIPHNEIPYLKVGDHVAVTNHARSLVNVDAYVYSIERTNDTLNAAARQVTTVNIPPTWI